MKPGRIWQEMQEKELRIKELIDNIKHNCLNDDTEVNAIIRSLRVSAEDTEHILIRAATEQGIDSGHLTATAIIPVPRELIDLLGEDTFVIVPLYSPGRSLGVIIADHFVTRQPITGELIDALESFASQASLAIEHCHLYMDMENKITQLEAMAHELEKNKDLLVEAERFSALGHMAAQLVHNIRNPITTIGGTARLLARKTDDPDQLKFLNMMIGEAAKIEETLQDLFSFVEQETPVKNTGPALSDDPQIPGHVLQFPAETAHPSRADPAGTRPDRQGRSAPVPPDAGPPDPQCGRGHARRRQPDHRSRI